MSTGGAAEAKSHSATTTLRDAKGYSDVDLLRGDAGIISPAMTQSRCLRTSLERPHHRGRLGPAERAKQAAEPQTGVVATSRRRWRVLLLMAAVTPAVGLRRGGRRCSNPAGRARRAGRPARSGSDRADSATKTSWTTS